MDIHKESLLNQIKNFIRELRTLFPEDNIFSVAEYSIKMYSTTDPDNLIKTFKSYLNEYRSKIEAKDETFFLTTEYDFNTSSYTEKIISQLRKKWKTLDSQNKKSIWLYLIVILKLADKCT